MKLKVCGLTNAQNIREILKISTPDYLGFIFYEHSSRFMPDRLKPEDVQSLPGDIQKTGVFVNSTVSHINKVAKAYGLNVLQLHGEESPAECERLQSLGFTIIKAFRIENSFDNNQLKKYSDVCDYFLFDTAGRYKGGNGKKFNWDILSSYSLDKPYFLSGGIKPEDASLVAGISDIRLFGIDVNSGFESEPGIKVAAKIQEFNTNLKKYYHANT